MSVGANSSFRSQLVVPRPSRARPDVVKLVTSDAYAGPVAAACASLHTQRGTVES